MNEYVKSFSPIIYLFLIFYLGWEFNFFNYSREWFFFPVVFCLVLALLALIMLAIGVFDEESTVDSSVVTFNKKQVDAISKEKLKSYIEGRYRGDSDNYFLQSVVERDHGLIDVSYLKNGTEHKATFSRKYMTN